MVLVRTTTVALVGNPNTGKTTLFNALAGMRQRVGNYPGVTVETKKGQMKWQDRTIDLIDLPGTYSLAPRSPDEMVAVDLILGHQEGEPRPNVILSIVDASNLERNLYLTTQALELGVPIVVALNMIDVAEVQGIKINVEQVSRQLGVKVVPIQANKGKGLDALKKAIAEAAEDRPPAKKPLFPPAFETETASLRKLTNDAIEPFLARRLLLDVGGYTEQILAQKHGEQIRERVQQARQRLEKASCPVPAIEARTRYAWIRETLNGCIERPKERPVTWTDRLDRWLTHKVFGTLVFIVIMFLVFQSIFTWAKPFMKWIGAGKDLLGDYLRDALPAGPFSSLLVDGMVEGVGSVLVFLPQIVILFAFIAILEDCGYMARAAFLMDRLMARCGLSGKSFIPMLSSVACAVPGIMAARVIENRRDRLATILVAPLMSCSARLPVYILLIAAFLTTGFAWWMPGLVMFAMYMIGIIVAPLVALALKRSLLRGETPLFVMEMPMYKWPSIRTVLRRVFDSGCAFIRRAGTLILASMVLVWALLYFPSTDANGQSYDEQIAKLRKSIEEPKDKLKEVEKELAGEKKELADVEKQLGKQPESAELTAKKKVLEAKIEEKTKPFTDVIEPVETKIGELHGEWKRQSVLGRMGHAIEPLVEPLGWDWKIGMAALASFPAREVVVGTLGQIYNQGKDEDSEAILEAEDASKTKLGKALRDAKWDEGSKHAGEPVYTVPTALSIMVFFALCCQCASTLAIIRRETGSWRWPAFTFGYMTALAYVAALLVFQIGSRLS